MTANDGTTNNATASSSSLSVDGSPPATSWTPHWPTVPVIVVERSGNNKISDPRGRGVSTTYVAQDSCPESCPLRGHGCYAETGWAGFQTYRINQVQLKRRLTLVELAEAEAMGIRRLTGTRRLRAHVVGDCRTPETANIVGEAMRAHESKHGQRAWTYTHAWRDIPLKDWRFARVLASCSTIQEVEQAHSRYYATALIIPPTTSRKAYQVRDFTVVPCPAQFHDKRTGARQTTCERCNICSDTYRNWSANRVVGFQPDGQTQPLEVTGKLLFEEM